MRRRRVPTKKQLRDQSKTQWSSRGIERADDARKIHTAIIKSAQRKLVRVTGNVAVTPINGGAIVGIGNDHDIGLVVRRPSNHPRLELACVIGRAQVCIANTASNLHTAEFVFQEDVEHPSHGIAAINGRRPILQDVDVINLWEGNEIDVHTRDAGRGTCTNPATATNYRSALSIDENESFFGQQPAQIGYDAAIPATDAIGVLVNSRAHLLR